MDGGWNSLLALGVSGYGALMFLRVLALVLAAEGRRLSTLELKLKKRRAKRLEEAREAEAAGKKAA